MNEKDLNEKDLKDLKRIIKLEEEKRRINEEALNRQVITLKVSKPLNRTNKKITPLKKSSEIRDLLHINKLDEEKRRINEEKLEEEIGIQKSLKKKYKPILEEFQKQEINTKEQIRAIQNIVSDFSIIPQHESSKIPLEIEPDYSSDITNMFERADDIFKMHFNKDLDTSFIKNEGFELPSELVNKSADELNTIIKKAKDRRDEYKRAKGNASKHRKTDQIQDADKKMNNMKKYIKALSLINLGKDYIGEGLEDKKMLLDKLTDKICQFKSDIPAKIYNQVVILIDRLHKEGFMTNDQVIRYYHKFLL
ncbi:hypothetical protein HNY73_021982 [Argiope bruennichi]|uniref:Uncharacterized protein n=1 Tax=Argiope bruennichi TaxID=94029 RepID=A0A8T0E154_ARGBR|nr:hypothetical protein HNY73_021982 [Argiope bruennichi]